MREKTNNVGSVQVRRKPGCIVTEDGLRQDFFLFRKKRNCTIRVAKTKAPLISPMQIAGFPMRRLKKL